MRNQEVKFLHRERIAIPFEREDQFTLRPDRGLHWLQQMCFWVLRKLKCFAVSERTEYRTLTIRTGDLMREIYQQHQELLNLYHSEGSRLLIGTEDYGRLVNDSNVPNWAFSFSGEYRNERHIYNMPITVVPWMSGMLVIPKDFD